MADDEDTTVGQDGEQEHNLLFEEDDDSTMEWHRVIIGEF